MIKRYKASTGVSINIVLGSGKNYHVSFTSLSNGSSVYVTNNEDVQRGMEHHRNFGKLFRLDAVIKEKPVEKKVEKKPVEKKENVQHVKVSDIAAAKDYMADRYGVSRTAMRSTRQIMEQAKQHGVVFEGF